MTQAVEDARPDGAKFVRMAVLHTLVNSILHVDTITLTRWPSGSVIELQPESSSKSSCLYFLHRLRSRVETVARVLFGSAS
jgi:hypothetical protein